MKVQPSDSAQRRLYKYNRSVPTPEQYAEIWDIEKNWVVARAEKFEAEAPRFDTRTDFAQALRERLDEEEANPSDGEQWLAEEATLDQFKVVVSEFAVDGLVESQSHLGIIRRLPSRSRMAVLRVLIDEFGCGNDDLEHSAIYAKLMTELGLPTDLEYYADRVEDTSFAYVNLFHWLADRSPDPEYFLGAYSYFESSVLYAFKPYAAASKRLGIENDKYYAEHLYIDSFHSRQMKESIRLLGTEREVDLAKVWTGVELTSQAVAEATEAAIGKAKAS
ncbi:iron-containing redox enzyme family protein [Sphaerisporangium sp. NPDC051017]|uniref:iron-containing redox enzyme family protein n=1 Tax=Sphaerisporangium sp. NPDC051017 TaxID=3154636 RepID=UPI00342C65AC